MTKANAPVLFITDIDGTLIDSKKAIAIAASETIKEFTKREFSIETFFPFIGIPIKNVLNDYIVSERLDEAVLHFRKRLIEVGPTHTSVMPSAIYTLERLKSAGSKLCAATNKIAPLARKVLEQHGLIEYFDEVYGSDLHRPKPSAEMIFSAMKEYPASVNLMFGDRPEDVIAANSAGVSSIFFSGEFDELLSKTGACPDFTVSGWHEILEIQEVWAVI